MRNWIEIVLNGTERLRHSGNCRVRKVANHRYERTGATLGTGFLSVSIALRTPIAVGPPTGNS